MRGVELDKIYATRAVPACERAVADDPYNPRLMHNYARALDRAGKYDAAERWYRRADDLGFDWASNNLGVLYLSGKGVPFDLLEGVSLLRRAAKQGNAQALVNYANTDYTEAFVADRRWIVPLEQALVTSGLADPSIVDGLLAADDWAAIDRYKSRHGLTDPGLTLRLLDQLGVLERLSEIRATSGANQEPREP